MLPPEQFSSLPLPPEGMVVLGKGNTFSASRDFHGACLDIDVRVLEWNVDNSWSGVLECAVFAADIHSNVVDVNRGQVERLNPRTLFPWQGLPNPTDYPELPDEHVLLGFGREFVVHGRENVLTCPKIGEPIANDRPHVWRVERQMAGNGTDLIYAVPFNHPWVALNLELVARLNLHFPIPAEREPNYILRELFHPNFTPVMTPTFRPPPENIEPVPEGMVMLGWGGEIKNPNLEIHHGASFSGNRTAWIVADRGFNSNILFYAAAPDSPVALLNPEAIAHYNPQITPEPVYPAIPVAAQWRLSFGGSPVSSREELPQLIGDMLIDASVLTDLCDILWGSLSHSNPEATVDSWIEREPVVMAQIDFHAIVTQPEELVLTGAVDSNRPIAELISRAAAGALLRGGMSNHFIYCEQGTIAINPANPPSLEQAYEMLGRAIETDNTADQLKSFSAWTLGALMDEFERFFPHFDVSNMVVATQRCANVLGTTLRVYRARWHNRKPNLSFTHHKEAECAHITDEQKDWVLDVSSERGLAVAQQRKLISYVRVYGHQPLEEDMPESTEDLMDRLETRAVNRNFLFQLQGRWYVYRGPFSHIPNGASPVLDADTRQLYDVTGTAPTNLPVWTPAGIEVPSPRGHVSTINANRAEAIAAGVVPRPSRGGRHQPRVTGESVALTQNAVEEAVREADAIIVDEPVSQNRADAIAATMTGMDFASTPPEGNETAIGATSQLTATELQTMYNEMVAMSSANTTPIPPWERMGPGPTRRP